MLNRDKRIEIINKNIIPEIGNYLKYLGEGFESIVLTDDKFVYKIFISKEFPTTIAEWRFSFLKSKINKFQSRKHLIKLSSLLKVNQIYILKYPYYNNFKKVESITKKEAISFLVECWQEKVVFTDVGLENFIKVNGILKYIDYSPINMLEYTDNLFLNMCARIFIDYKYTDIDYSQKKLIKRSSINNFNIPELEGFHSFLNEVFSNIILSESSHVNKFMEKNNIQTVSPYEEIIKLAKSKSEIKVRPFSELNFEILFWKLLKANIRLLSVFPHNIKLNNNLYHEPQYYTIKVKRLHKLKHKVSLVIKACPQESDIIYEQVKHIIKQLSTSDIFYEKIIAIDKKENDYLRQYSSGNLEKLYQVIQKLVDDSIIDYYIELPDDEIIATNKRWFNIATNETHTIKNIPVTPQLYAFEEAKGDYILQMDADVMIGRKDYNHSFLNDMINEFNKNDKVVSVGFNIPKNENVKFVEYHAPQNGGYVPEVRFALIHKKRLLGLRPLPNELIDGKLKLSWYRSLHLHQKKTGFTSLRGGNPNSFYIHPQNYRKKCKDVWFTILDRVEKNVIPDVQREEFDLAGSYYDWTIPKRNEDLIIITLLHNVSYDRFLRTWNSVVSQSYKDFGWIIIDDASENGIDILINSLIEKYNRKDKITFIKNKVRQGYLANTYKAIHYFCNNPQSIITIIDGDDAIIGNNVLENILKRYKNGADVTLGKMYRTDKLYAHYPYNPNFTNPRLTGGNVWQHLRTFKKYLFDSINLPDLKKVTSTESMIQTVNNKYKWYQYCADYAYMVPIIEMSENPVRIEEYNYYHERTTPSTKEIKNEKEKIIAEILNKPKYTPENVIKDTRKSFETNLNYLEIDITYDCNLKCISCNRSSTQAPTKEYMSIKQIENFINESIEIKKKWKFINILGGEPTLHPDFEQIIRLIYHDYIFKFSPDTILQITSNGFTEKSRKLLDKIEKSYKNIVIDRASFKTSNKIEYFTPFNNAPIDNEESKNCDFSKACWVTSYCGVGLNKYGYYPCGVAAGIDRVMGFDKGIKSLKEVTPKKMKELLNTFCRYCGNYIDYMDNMGNFIPRCEKAPLKQNVISQTWKKYYSIYKFNNPKLTKIYE